MKLHGNLETIHTMIFYQLPARTNGLSANLTAHTNGLFANLIAHTNSLCMYSIPNKWQGMKWPWWDHDLVFIAMHNVYTNQMLGVQKGLRTYNFKLTHFNKNQSVKIIQTFWNAIRTHVSRCKDLKVTRSIKRVPHVLINKIFCMEKIQSRLFN